MSLYNHQQRGISWLTEREGAGLFWEMGTGKSRTALLAARKFYDKPANAKQKIDAVLVLAPASVCYAWREELRKLSTESASFPANLLRYDPKRQQFVCEEVLGTLNGNPVAHIPVAVVSYALLQQKRHVTAVSKWCLSNRVVLICDESSFLKNRTAAQTRGAKYVASSCHYRWLLSGTPVCNSPLDLWAQAETMYPDSRGRGPLAGFANFFHFRATFAETLLRKMGTLRFNEIVGYKNLDKLQKRFSPFVSRVEKKDCLDLPPKSYTVREVALSESTWKIYQELKREAMLALPDSEAKPEPNAAVRILRLCQITSGHVGLQGGDLCEENGERLLAESSSSKDIGNEKLKYATNELVDGELSSERAVIVWCRWRRERERLGAMLYARKLGRDFAIQEVFGGQSQNLREIALQNFQSGAGRQILLAQPHAGGFGLNLTAAHTAIYLSNDWSFSTRVQSEDRCHRIGQVHPVLYIDVVAVSPRGGATIDHKILEALRAKKSIAEWTCSAWRKALED